MKKLLVALVMLFTTNTAIAQERRHIGPRPMYNCEKVTLRTDYYREYTYIDCFGYLHTYRTYLYSRYETKYLCDERRYQIKGEH